MGIYDDGMSAQEREAYLAAKHIDPVEYAHRYCDYCDTVHATDHCPELAKTLGLDS
jgi:hypothetical protein